MSKSKKSTLRFKLPDLDFRLSSKETLPTDPAQPLEEQKAAINTEMAQEESQQKTAKEHEVNAVEKALDLKEQAKAVMLELLQPEEKLKTKLKTKLKNKTIEQATFEDETDEPAEAALSPATNNATANNEPQTRLTIGLALGSGAAKGWAHIGVLNGLAKMGIFPDKIAGSSIGALVGAAYAGNRLPELQAWVEGFSQWDVFSLMDLSWNKSGIIGGERVFNALEKHIGDMTIESLPIPYTAVATDLYSGQEIWFKEGELRHALRASCSIPGILSPVRQGERWLVDGAVVNPVPVSVARAMGVDVVIAVDLSGDRHLGMHNAAVNVRCRGLSADEHLEADQHQATGFTDLLAKGRDYLSGFADLFSNKQKPDPSMLAVMSQSLEILEERHKRARLMGDPPDVCILPRVPDIGILEFHRAKEAIAAGEQAVLRAQHQLEIALGRDLSSSVMPATAKPA